MASITITFDDPGDQFGELAALIEADIQTAWNNWMAVFDFAQDSTIELVVRPSNQSNFLVQGRSLTDVETTSPTALRPGVGAELLSGEDPNDDAFDGELLVSIPAIGGLRFTGNPTGTVSAITVLMHEFGHMIAFNEQPGAVNSVFETFVTTDPAKAFVANFAVAANNGQPVPLADGGNLSEAALPTALMSATVTDANQLLDVERAMLFDMGFPVLGIDDLIEENTNNPPVAGDDNFQTLAIVPINFVPNTLLLNDSDPNGDPLFVTGVSLQAGFGALVTEPNGSFTYNPTGFYNDLGPSGVALVTLNYTLSDGRGGTDIGKITIRVDGVPPGNQLPVAANDTFVMREDAVLELLSSELVANDSDLDNGTLVVTAIALADGSEVEGLIEDLGDGVFTYTPAGRFPGLNEGDVTVENLVYTLEDGQGGSVEGTIEIAIEGVTEPLEGTDDDDEFTDDPELDETFVGGDGRDTVVFAGLAEDKAVTIGEDGNVTVTGGGATDVLEGIERAAFDDGTYVFDLEGEFLEYVYRTYSAAFARTPDEEGLEFWNDIMNTGDFTEEEIAQFFVDSPEFAEKFGENVSDAQFINALYLNVLLREADANGFIFWLDVFQSGEQDRADMLVFFAESPENVERNAPFLDNGVFVIEELPPAGDDMLMA